jgi:hypothetical protein
VNRTYQGGIFGAEHVDGYFQIFMEKANSGKSFMANINNHWVVVDGFDASRGMVKIRDPWNSNIPKHEFKVFEFGRTAEVNKSVFSSAWKNTEGSVVW